MYLVCALHKFVDQTNRPAVHGGRGSVVSNFWWTMLMTLGLKLTPTGRHWGDAKSD